MPQELPSSWTQRNTSARSAAAAMEFAAVKGGRLFTKMKSFVSSRTWIGLHHGDAAGSAP